MGDVAKKRNVVNKLPPLSQEHINCCIDILPDMLLMEILCRLPDCKSVVPCKAVCTRWDTLVSQPYFITHFINHNFRHGSNNNDDIIANQNGGGCNPEMQLVSVVTQNHKKIHQDGVLMRLRRPFSDPKGIAFGNLPSLGGEDVMPIKVVGAFNDLLLCHKQNSDLQKHELFLCNVQTRQWHMLPPPPLVSNSNHFGFLCEPYYYFEKGNRNSHSIPNVLYKYSIVIVPHKYQGKMCFTDFPVLIYLSETNQWCKSHLSLPRPTKLESPDTCGFGFNGMIHIRSLYYVIGFDPYSNSDASSDGHGGGVIQCHDLNWPSNEAITHVSFSECQGRLQASRIDDYGRLDVWILQDYNLGIWSLHHTLRMKDFVPHPPTLGKHLKTPLNRRVLGFHPSTTHLIYICCGGYIVLCDMQKRSAEVACRIPSNVRKLFFSWNTIFWITLPVWPTPLHSCEE